ncbi:MAG TPA: hypothetical protein ENH53_07280, partial [Bacteroidetes bacterium]|nr:hypothetical protein [Bacteroidota bacterium]
MKKLIIVPLLMGFLAFGMVTPSHAGGIAITATGVRAVSLGGAYRALSGDWSGGYWNPAGLTQVKNWNFGASVSFITPLAKITLAPYQGHRLYGFAYREAVAKPQTFIIPNLGLVKTLDNGLSVGLGLFIPFGLGATWDLYNPVPGFGNTANFPKDDNVGNVQVMDFHLSLAYPVTEQLSLGVGAGLVYSTLSMEQTTVTKIAALNPQLAPIAIAPHDHFPVDQTLKGTGVSASASVGLQLKATDQLTLGLAARFYQNVPLKGSVVGDAYFPYSANALGTLKALHDAKQLSDAEYQQAAVLFSGTKQQMIDDNEVKASMPLPMNIGAGVAFRPMENLLLSFDVSFTQWSVWNVIKIENLTMKDGTPV